MGRQPRRDKIGIKRGPWTIEEDRKLVNFINNNGIQCWRLVPKLAGLMRCRKSCRLRWINYLRPDLKRGSFTESEEDMIIQLHSRYGNRWSKIALHFPGRTDNEIKNQWNTKMKKKLKQLELDPLTHEPIPNPKISNKDDKLDIPSSSSETQENKTPELEIDTSENNFNIQINEILENSSISETRSSNEFSSGISGLTFDDFYPQLLQSPNNMLSWDNFSCFDEVFYDMILPNMYGTNIF